MENVRDQTSAYAPPGMKDLSVIKVMHKTVVRLMFLISEPILLHDLLQGFLSAAQIMFHCLQMWMSAVSWRDHVPTAAWIHTVAIVVTVNLDTHSAQMDTPAPVSHFQFKQNV